MYKKGARCFARSYDVHMTEQISFENQLEAFKVRMDILDEQEKPVDYVRALTEDILLAGCGLNFEQIERLSFILGPIFLSRRKMKILFGIREFEAIKSLVIQMLHVLLPDAPISITPPNSEEVLRQFGLQKRGLDEVIKSLVANTEFCRKLQGISPEMPNELGQLVWEHAQFELSRSNTSLKGAIMKPEFLIYLLPALWKRGVVSREQYELYFEAD